MKKNQFGLFMIGISMGGGLTLLVFGFLQLRNVFRPQPTVTLIPTQDHLPHLIALEPTTVRQAAIHTPAAPIVTAKPSLAPIQPSASSTPTPLLLRNELQSEIIGYSVEGRPLEVYTFGKGEHERMIVGGIHGGDEWNTVTLANQLIEYLDQDLSIIPEDVKLYILPDLNPDGEARAHNKYGRLNHNGVDLNRNFPVNWQRNWDRSGCWNYLPTSGGTGPGSEAETQALMSFTSSHKIQVLIGYHSAALGIFPGGLPADESSTRLAQALAEVTSYRFPPIDTGCAYSGTLADYAVSIGIAAVDLELTNHIDTDFDQNLQALNVLLHFVP
ncbi:MAG TPA: M14 family metallopeptidase [Anaerolineales bacterium]|nr:M14 family metallopeptidase [Anaerolineales bacterium]